MNRRPVPKAVRNRKGWSTSGALIPTTALNPLRLKQCDGHSRAAPHPHSQWGGWKPGMGSRLTQPSPAQTTASPLLQSYPQIAELPKPLPSLWARPPPLLPKLPLRLTTQVGTARRKHVRKQWRVRCRRSFRCQRFPSGHFWSKDG